MSDKAAGWYPDPDGANQQRYWDGDSWTDYYTPLAPAATELHGAATATADYPYLTATKHGPHPDLMARPIPQGSSRSGGWPSAPHGSGQEGETLEFNGGGRRSGGGRWMLVTVSALVVALVVVLGWWALGGSGPGTPGGPTATGPTGPVPTSTGEPLELDASTTGEIGGYGFWVSSLSLDADTLLSIDVRASESSADLRLTLLPQGGGDPVASNDDRGGALAPTGGNALNPLLVAAIPAGEYDVEIDNRAGQDTDFDLSVVEIDEELPLGSPVDGTTADDGAWVTFVTIPADGDYVVDVTGRGGDSADPVLVMIGPDGQQLVNDDRGQGDADPLLEESFEQGVWVVLVLDYDGRSIDVTVRVDTAP